MCPGRALWAETRLEYLTDDEHAATVDRVEDRSRADGGGVLLTRDPGVQLVANEL